MYVHGGDIYRGEIRRDFSANLNFLGMPEAVKRAAWEGILHSEHYPDVRCEALRRAISEKEGVDAGRIVCGNGAADLIFSLVLAEKPGRAVVFAPTFHEYLQALETVGCEVVCHVLKEEEEFRYTEEILEDLTDSVNMLVICNPNNPTGQVMAPALLKRILEVCQERRIRVLLDECFVDFLDEPQEHTAVLLLEQYSCLFILKAFTKLYAMAGLRLGYGMTSDEELIDRLVRVRQPWNVSVPAQYAGIAALGETEYVARYRRLLRGERAYLKEELVKMGMRVYGSQANYIFFRGRPGLKEELLGQGILIRDCSNYEGLSEGYYRIAVRSHEENEELTALMRKFAGQADPAKEG